MTPITVIILTKNEEALIGRCIKSVQWADEVLVVDSGSTDRTREIASSLGAKVYVQEWLGWPGQRNKAANVAKNDWVFFIDADEIVTPELAESIQKVIISPDGRDVFSVDRRGDFLGLLLPNMGRRKNIVGFVRIYNKHYSGFDTSIKVHESIVYSSQPILLKGFLLHWRGYVMDEYIPVGNRYATIEAEVLNESGYRATGLIIFLRPILRFLWCYIAKGGIFLGTRGLIHAMLQATNEYVRYAKLWEMQNIDRVLHPPASVYREPSATQIQPVASYSISAAKTGEVL